MKKLGHLTRAALIGFLAFATIGALLTAADTAGKRTPSADVESIESAESGAPGASAGDNAEASIVAGMFGMGLLGAVAGVGCALLLLLFPVGPVAKTLFGVVCGPVLPALFLGPKHVANGGSPDDLGGIVLIGMILGLLVGALDGSRVAGERRASPSSES